MVEKQSVTTLGQAIRNATEAERAAARFYEALARRAGDGQARVFFEEMVRDERQHAELLESYGGELGEAYAAQLPEAAVQRIEVVPGWEYAESISIEQALEVAIEAENNAALYYDAMADFTEGDVQAFFRRMATLEEAHAERPENGQITL